MERKHIFILIIVGEVIICAIGILYNVVYRSDVIGALINLLLLISFAGYCYLRRDALGSKS